MRINPRNKYFIAIVALVILVICGIVIASILIFIDFKGDVELTKIEFKQSNFAITVKQQKSDKNYVVELYNSNIRLMASQLNMITSDVTLSRISSIHLVIVTLGDEYVSRAENYLA